MTNNPEPAPADRNFEGSDENITAFEVLQGSFDSQIAAVSARYQAAQPETREAKELYDLLRELTHARRLLHPDRPDTLELAHLYLKRLGASSAA